MDSSHNQAEQNQAGPQAEASSTASSQNVPPGQGPIPARQRYVHLYMPLIAVLLILTNPLLFLSLLPTAGKSGGRDEILFVGASAVPVYFVGSLFYPANRPPPTPEEARRFTRKSELYRAGVLFSYGLLHGTPFDLQRFISDFILSHTADHIIGERGINEPQRSSEFFVALLWLGGSYILWSLVPPSMGTLWLILGIADRTIWRSAYIALVDDCIKVMTRPNVHALKGKLTLVLVQSITITTLTYLALSWATKLVPQAVDIHTASS